MEYFERLKQLREDNDLTQADVADFLNTTKQQVSKWENGIQIMGVDKIVKLAKFYNISADYLLGLTDTPEQLK